MQTERFVSPSPPSGPARVPEPVAPAADSATLAAELAALQRERTLVESGPFVVFVAGAEEIPNALYEVARLREVSFRSVGEGTGAAIDLDWFDSHYSHLVLWQRERREIVGSYRLGATDAILPRFGIDGLYTATLFDYRAGFLERITPALELGRSFVRPEYQKSYSALMLLWKGIGRYLVCHPWYRMLFGAVSISNDYSLGAQSLIVRYLVENHFLAAFARFVEGRNAPGLEGPWRGDVGPSIEDVAHALAGMEGKSVPVLVRQYLKLGGRILAFSRDPDFADSLDGLMLVDLAAAEPGVLRRYLGEAGVETFFDYHRRRPARYAPWLDQGTGEWRAAS